MTSPLLHMPADIVRWLLVANGAGTDPMLSGEWPIYESKEPDAPDNCITVYDTLGTNDGRIMLTGQMVNHPGMQIRIRAVTSPVGAVKAQAIYTLITTGIYNQALTIATATYLVQSLSPRGDVLPIGQDTPNSRRSIFTINAVVSLRKTN